MSVNRIVLLCQRNHIFANSFQEIKNGQNYLFNYLFNVAIKCGHLTESLIIIISDLTTHFLGACRMYTIAWKDNIIYFLTYCYSLYLC